VAGLELPANLSLVTVDFEKESLIIKLRMSGYRTDAAGFFSWLGVTMYLSTDAIFGTLRAVPALAPGTEIIFEYSVRKNWSMNRRRRCWRRAGRCSSSWPAKLAEQVRKVGFAEVTGFSPDEINARSYTDRTDGLRTHPLNHCMRARVGPPSN
jgi:O-methyltransferase involved in polyketide biosynthesis